VRGTLRVAKAEPIELGEFSFFESSSDAGYVDKLIVEIADVPREHWPTISAIEQDPCAIIPRWPFETRPCGRI